MFTQFEQDYPQTKFRIVRYGMVYSQVQYCVFGKINYKRWGDYHYRPCIQDFLDTWPKVDLIFDCMENAVKSFPLPKYEVNEYGWFINAMVFADGEN